MINWIVLIAEVGALIWMVTLLCIARRMRKLAEFGLTEAQKCFADAESAQDDAMLKLDQAIKTLEEAQNVKRTYEMARNLDQSGVFGDIQQELQWAQQEYEPMHSAHEGYAVIHEEVGELWDEVRVKDSQRDVGRMRQEAVQVAAMAIRFVQDVCDKEVVR